MKRASRAMFPFMVLGMLLVLVSAASAANHTYTGSFTLVGENDVQNLSATAGVPVTIICDENTVPGDGLGHVHVEVRDPIGGRVDNLCCWDGTLTFTPAMTGTYAFDIYAYWDGAVTYNVSINTGVTNQDEEPAAVVPGCDTGLNLTSDSVVGTFLVNTTPLWEPVAGQFTDVSIPAGKTAWVLGVDASGQYYKFYWNCSELWAPVSALGPNPDAVWNGKPLPTVVMK